MTRLIFIFTLAFSTQFVWAQNNIKENIAAMNKLLVDFSPEESANFNVIEQSGIVEQNFNNLIQRYNLSEIGLVSVSKKEAGFSVSFSCKDSGKCISLIRENGTNVNLVNTSYFFKIDAAANSFAENAQRLIQHFKTENDSCKINLFIAENGKTNRLKINTTKTKPKEVIAETPANIDDDVEDVSEKSKVIKTTKEKTKNEAEDVISEKTAKKKEKEEDKLEETDNLSKQEKAEQAFCNQLFQLVDAGNKTQFKNIQGKETNADKKINESLFKLKGAKKNYLTQYKNKRAFIAEIRVSSELELMNMEFDDLQTQVENCLTGEWEDIDHSSDEEYDNAQEQVRDIEYHNISNKNSVSIRIIMIFDGKKYVQFIRIN